MNAREPSQRLSAWMSIHRNEGSFESSRHQRRSEEVAARYSGDEIPWLAPSASAIGSRLLFAVFSILRFQYVQHGLDSVSRTRWRRANCEMR